MKFNTDWLQLLLASLIFLLIVAAVYCIYAYGVWAFIIMLLIVLIAWLIHKLFL